MSEKNSSSPKSTDQFENIAPEKHPVRSLRELIDIATGRNLSADKGDEDYGLAELLPFPFLGLVGQNEMKLGLLLALINPSVGGTLLIGPRGTGKTTAVRSLTDLLPDISRSLCFYGCTVEDIETGGIDAVCPDCARKYAEGKPLSRIEKARIVELPLNATLDDVVGKVDERAATHDRFRLKRGILAQADKNILYIDEVNLLSDEIIDAILDAAAQGSYTVRRGPIAATYKSHFTLIGSMNPEEGNLRPQIMDRFGLRVIVRGLEKPTERLQAYNRVLAYQHNPRKVIQQYLEETASARDEIIALRGLLPKISLSQDIAQVGIHLIKELEIDSLRAEITLFEASRAYAAADGRNEVTIDDLRLIAPMALRLRQSTFINRYFAERMVEDTELSSAIDRVFKNTTQADKP